MVSPQDYTGNGSLELPKSFVNGSLTVFRHFGLDGDEMKPTGIKPMGHNWSDEHAYYPHQNEFTALCRKDSFGSGSGKADHEPPSHTCRCGFYASYSPYTDFYDTFLGFRLFGACEVSGRVIMGDKGVRAQKMKIKGLWLQPKIRQVDVAQMKTLREVRKTEAWFPRGWVVYDVVTACMRMKAAGHDVADQIEVECDGVPQDIVKIAMERGFEDYDRALTVLDGVEQEMPNLSLLESAYGIKFYDTREALLEAYPAEDVSELIKKDPGR